MLHEEWRYEWIKTLVQEGVPVETAKVAFKEGHGKIDAFILKSDPVASAKTYLRDDTPTTATV